MTADQAKALKKAYNASLTSTTTTSDGAKVPEYATLDYETQKKWEKDFKGATTYAQLEAIGERMQQSRVDPEIVAWWVDHYAELKGLVPKTEKPKFSSTSNLTAGGAPAGMAYMETR